MSSCREDIEAAFAGLDAAFEAVTELSFDVLTTCERQRLLARLETHRRRLPTVEHPLINQLAAEPAPEALGAASLAEALATGLRISKSVAKQRICEAQELGRRTTLSGDLLDPVLPTVATAQAAGLLGAEHIEVIRKFFSKLPDAIDYQTREKAEKDLGRLATEFGPAELRRAADRLAYVLDQDGPAPTDADRARRRYFTIGKQRADGMTPFHGLLDPEGRATMEAVLAKTAAPGMCNPDDIKPCVDERTARRCLANRSANPASTQSRCTHGNGPCNVGVWATGPAQRIARHHRRLDDAQGARIGCGTWCHR